MIEQLTAPGPQEAHRPPRPTSAPRSLAGLSVALVCLGGAASCSTEAAANPPVTEVATAQPWVFDLNQLSFDEDPTIIQLEDPLPNPRGGEKITPQGITLHWWGFSANGNIEALKEALENNQACGDTGCSVQYGVTEDGEIYRMMASATEWAYHASGANPTTFGIEIEGGPEDFTLDGDTFNRAKFEAVASLAAELVDDFDLPINGTVMCQDVSGIHAHYEYNGCPTASGDKTDVNHRYTQAVIAAVESMQ